MIIVISWWRTFGVQFQAFAYSVMDTISPCIDVTRSGFLFFVFYSFLPDTFTAFSKFKSGLYITAVKIQESFQFPRPFFNVKCQIYRGYLRKERETLFSMDVQIPSSKDFFNRMSRNINRHSSNSGLSLNFLVISHCLNKLIHLCIHQLLFIMLVHEYALVFLQNVTNGNRIGQKIGSEMGFWQNLGWALGFCILHLSFTNVNPLTMILLML